MSSTSFDLLDVNFLLAAAWPVHQFHASTHHWFAGRQSGSWVSCALTQFAFVRLSTNPKVFKDPAHSEWAIDLLRRITAQKGHIYWRDRSPIPRCSRTE